MTRVIIIATAKTASVEVGQPPGLFNAFYFMIASAVSKAAFL
jgi:hypothetical protein